MCSVRTQYRGVEWICRLRIICMFIRIYTVMCALFHFLISTFECVISKTSYKVLDIRQCCYNSTVYFGICSSHYLLVMQSLMKALHGALLTHGTKQFF